MHRKRTPTLKVTANRLDNIFKNIVDHIFECLYGYSQIIQMFCGEGCFLVSKKIIIFNRKKVRFVPRESQKAPNGQNSGDQEHQR